MAVNTKEIRREFHKYPETGWREYRTSARIAEILEGIGNIEILQGIDVVDVKAIIDPVHLDEDTRKAEVLRAIKEGANPEIIARAKGYPGVIAIIDSDKPGPTTAFRFDIDALPYSEIGSSWYRPTKEGFCSVVADANHACGHDGHTAIGLSLADRLIESGIIKNGRVKIIFEPAEETFSGAESIVSMGHLDDVDFFVGIHLALSGYGRPLKSGEICCGCKDFLSDRQIDVHFEGKAAHPCGASQEGKNALLASCTAALNLHSIAPHEAGLFRVNVGEIHAGVCANTIAPNALLRVEYRGETAEISAYGKQRVEAIIRAAALMYEMDYKLLDYGEVPAGKSDDAMMKKIEAAAKNVPYFKDIIFEGHVGGTDDATVMMSRVQSRGGIATFVGIGTDSTDVLHGESFDFDEDCMDATVDMLANMLSDIHK